MHRTLTATLVFAAVAIAAIAALSWLSYRTVRVALEGEFSRRLEGVASTGASQVSPDDLADALLLGEDGSGYIVLQVLLEQLRATPGTVGASLLDSASTVVYDSRSAELQRQPSPLDSLIGPDLARALAGATVVSRPFLRDGEVVRAGLAPIAGTGGRPVAVLVVEARPAYLAELERVGQRLGLATGIIVLVVVALGAVISRGAWSAAQLERRLSRAENLAAMGRLTATLAHEIKNPLAIIRGSAQRLGRLEPEARRMADFVVEETDRLSHTVGRYLQFARGDAAQDGAGDAGAALAATLDLLEGELRARRIELERADAAGPMPVRLDNESLKQIYLNLILNAAEAMADGGRLRVACADLRSRFEISIGDSGPGMPAEVLRQLGQPFITTKAQGTGLGLFLIRRMLASVGGALEIRSEAGRGTTCVVRLPRRQE